MPDLGGSIGLGAANRPEDVRLVKQLLNLHASRLGFTAFDENGTVHPPLFDAIKQFQRAMLGTRFPDGAMAPGDRTFKRLQGASQTANATQQAQDVKRKARLSGAAWLRSNGERYPNSASIGDLAPAFGAHVRDFLGALKTAGAHVTVSATRRNADRAFIMHWSWMVANGQVAAAKVPHNPHVDIEWDHGNDRDSRKAAEEMVKAFHIAFKPSLTSRHIQGLAIDMTIGWDAPIKVRDRDGKDVIIDKPRSGATNGDLHRVGKTYGVVKLLSDPPHWSSDGH